MKINIKLKLVTKTSLSGKRTPIKYSMAMVNI
jgi:hypothetical protein